MGVEQFGRGPRVRPRGGNRCPSGGHNVVSAACSSATAACNLGRAIISMTNEHSVALSRRREFQAAQLFALDGKTVMLTGAAGFLGRTFSEAILDNGGRVVAIGRPGRLERQVSEWQTRYGASRITGYPVDMYDTEAFDSVLTSIVEREPVIDVLVNNAYDLSPTTGFNSEAGTLDEASHDQWMRSLTAGVYWPAAAVQRVGAG